MGFFRKSEEEKERERQQKAREWEAQELWKMKEALRNSFGVLNLDSCYENFAPKMTYALYHIHDTLLAIAQEATTLKAKNEELERRCEEQSRIIETQSHTIEALTQERTNNRSR